uniref:CUB domain-containing protein n=1 Tax=Macrostomum lignano TaxID=282301 RepID=A0A1I8GA39_9PLAT
FEHISGPCTNQVRFEKFSGIIDHPGAGKNYSADSDVCWLIEIEGSVAIRFTKFDLENNYDWIKIYEDTTLPESESKVRFHLSNVEQVANSEFWLTGRVVLIRFKSDTSVQKTGFRLKYRKIPFYTLPVAGGPSAVEIISGASAGVVHSHAGFEKGKNYSHNVQQAWSIRAQPSQLIRVTFTTFNTEKNFDFLRIFSGALPNVQSSEMYANLSGNIAKPTDYNFFGSLTFVFSSDRSNNGKGFRFMYQILQTEYRYLANETRLKFQLRPRKSDPDSLYCVGAVLCHVSWKSEAYRNIEYSLDLPKPDPTSLSIHLVRPDLWTQTGLIEFFAVSESVCPKVRHRCELRTEDGRIVEARILQVTASPTKPASCHISSLKTLFATPIPGNGSFDATTIACRLNDGNFIKYRVTSKTFTESSE